MEHLRSYKWVVKKSLIEELKAFHQAILGKSDTLATGRDGMLALQIAHTASRNGHLEAHKIQFNSADL